MNTTEQIDSELRTAVVKLSEAIQLAIRIEEAELADNLKDGWAKDSMPIASSKQTLETYNAALKAAKATLKKAKKVLK